MLCITWGRIMIKIILGVFATVFVLVSTMVVLYWRDVNYDPATRDLLIFFGLIPFALTFLMVMPFLIKKWYQEQQERKNNPKAVTEEDHTVAPIPAEIEWVKLNVFSCGALSALGENESIWDEVKNFKSAELDQKLQNGYGLPILSYRIADLDDLMADEDQDEFGSLSARQRRISALIQQQLEQQTPTLWQIAEHLKKSSLFYEGQLVQEYRMHPAWIDPNADVNDEPSTDRRAEQVARLNQLQIHLILAEDVLHIWDENDTQEKIEKFLAELGYIPQKFHVEFHYWGKETAYKKWLDLLQQIEKSQDTVNLILAVDSEIDQDTVDEKTWVSEHYIPSEFVGSCCIAPTSVLINELLPQKTIKIALNDAQLSNTLEQLNYQKLEQYQQEQPFVMQLDDITDLKVLKRLEQNFAQTLIEQHHYLFMKQSMGQTENIAKVFGFMLALQAPDDFVTLVYCCEQPHTQSFIQTVEDDHVAV